MTTTVDQMAAPVLPPCDPRRFDGLLEVGLETVDVTPGRQQLHMDLVARGVEPPGKRFGERPLVRWVLQDKAPWIVITLFSIPAVARGNLAII
jgi:hypothetical protein